MEQGGDGGLDRSLRIVVLLALALLAMVAVTGVWLVFQYRPDPITLPGAPGVGGDGQTQLVRRIHWAASSGLALASVAAVILAMIDRHGRRVAGIAIAVVAVLLIISAWITGLLLPWSQLALNSVQVGKNFRGYRWLWDGQDVKFVLVRRSEVSTTTVATLFIAHLILALLVGAAFTWVYVRAIRLRRHAGRDSTADHRVPADS